MENSPLVCCSWVFVVSLCIQGHLSVLSVTLCLAVISDCLCFCLDYYGMQLAAEPLPVYCPHPGLGIITDITRLFTVWEPR